jgi:hypothetical protein
MYEIVVLVAVLAAFVSLGIEIYKLNMQLRTAHAELKSSREEVKAERERLISVLAAAQSDKIQYSLGFLTDSDMVRKRQEEDAMKKSFQSND